MRSTSRAGFLELRIEEKAPERSAPVTLYCAGGTRSALAAKALHDLGYTDVVSLAGGFARWKESGQPVAVPRTFTAEQRERYSRHLRIPEVGEAGQARLLDAKVLLIGAGGLGSPAGLYLAAAGVGTLGVADFDVVDLSNLQRQVLHRQASVGRPKTESAAATITALNPDVRVVRHDVRLDAHNVADVIDGYDVILDGSDNFSTKYLVNDAAVLAGKPLVYGSIFRFDGQASVFLPRQGPCYRCLYPEPTPPELAPSCDDAGVLGVLPGVIGLVQATEVVKLILGRGRSARRPPAHLRRAGDVVPRVRGAPAIRAARSAATPRPSARSATSSGRAASARRGKRSPPTHEATMTRVGARRDRPHAAASG